MSTDLSAAVEVGRIARRAAYFDGRTADECAEAAVTAAAPVIAAQVRAQVAADIDRERWSARADRRKDKTDAIYERLARIARGESS